MDTEKQKEVLRQMLDTGFGGGDSLTGLREKLGIDGETWEAWLREGGMPGDLVSLSKAMAEMCAPWVWASLLELTKGGSVPAMKLYFELCREKGGAAAENTGEREIQALRQEIFGGVQQDTVPDRRGGGMPDGSAGTGNSVWAGDSARAGERMGELT